MRAQQLQDLYHEEVSVNFWQETDKAKMLKQEFEQVNKEHCLECGKKASITCQYH